jgi:hypothetical protein
MRSIASAPSRITGAYLLPVYGLRDCSTGVPNEAGNLFDRHAVVGEQGDEIMPQLSGGPFLRY